jgi:hypothetical protein
LVFDLVLLFAVAPAADPADLDRKDVAVFVAGFLRLGAPTPFWVFLLEAPCLELRVLAALFIVLNKRVDATFGATV